MIENTAPSAPPAHDLNGVPEQSSKHSIAEQAADCATDLYVEQEREQRRERFDRMVAKALEAH